jgi:hypothetical protein
MDFVSIAQAARAVGIDPRTLRKLVDQGEVKATLISPKRLRVDLNQLREWFIKGGMKTQAGRP